MSDEFGDLLERGYDGTETPVNIEDIIHGNAPAVIVGALRIGNHLVTAEGRGILIVENAATAD